MPLSADQTEFTKEIQISDYECDVHNKLRLSDILRHMQDISAGHLVELGLPSSVLFEKGQVFLLSKISLDIDERPCAGDVIRFVTTPKRPLGAQFLRVNELYKDGRCLMRARTTWLLVNPENHQILRPAKFEWNLPLLRDEDAETLTKQRLSPPGAWEKAGTHHVSFSELDVNRHMNNAIYADIVCDAVPQDIMMASEPKHLFIHYQHEAGLSAKIGLKRSGFQQDWFIRGENTDTGKNSFDARLVLQTITDSTQYS